MYNRAVMIDSGIGSDINDFDAQIASLRRMISNEPAKSVLMLNNMQQLIHFVVNNTSPKLTAFVALIREINGKELTAADLTDEGTKRVLSRLAKTKMPVSIIWDFLKDVKKKSTLSLKHFFPTNRATRRHYNNTQY
jgi:hypothetical protein